MKNKICLIHHSIGLGDIFFLQTIARKYLMMGYQILWPLRPKELEYMPKYIPDITFCSIHDDFPGKSEYWGKDAVIISPNFVYIGITVPHFWGFGCEDIMKSKYEIMNMDWSQWHDGFKFNRNYEKEDKLYYDVLGLTDDSEYVLKNDMCSVDIRRTTALDHLSFWPKPVVNLKVIDGYTVFDWCKVFINAVEIHTVHTGICYILDRLPLQCINYYMYQGLQDPNVQYIPFKKKPIWVPNPGGEKI